VTTIRRTLAAATLLGVCSCGPRYLNDPTPHDPHMPTALCGSADPQKGEFCLPVDAILAIMRAETFTVIGVEPTTDGTSRPARLMLAATHEDQPVLFRAKWKPAPNDGASPNNNPPKELAAHALQYLFLTEDEAVVPPTVAVCFPEDMYDDEIGEADPQFTDTACVFGVLSYWVENVTDEGVWDEERMQRDPAYARAVAHLNLFTYLSGHVDSREGNLLISTDLQRPRALAIDNGLTFGSLIQNPVSQAWKDLRVSYLPADTVERLREIDSEDLDSLATVEQFAEIDERLVRSPPGPPMDPEHNVRYDDGVLQLGLSGDEIQGVRQRWHELLLRIERDELAVLP
jgi:hypothetical protein